MTRAITPTEQYIMRQNGQWSLLGLFIVKPAVVATMYVNGVFPTNDNVGYCIFDNAVSGSVSALQANNLTGWLGSTPGAYDLGMFRVMNIYYGSGSASTSGSIAVGLTSEVQWQDNAYITLVLDYGVWPKTSIFDPTSGIFLCDNDKAYTDQHLYLAPVPIMGPDALLYIPPGGTSPSLALDATKSWTPVSGSTAPPVNYYNWASSGSGVILVGANTATPTATFTLPGVYDLECTAGTGSGSNARFTTGHRVVAVYSDANPLLTQFTLDECRGDVNDGGWTFTVTMYGQADLGSVVDRAKVFLGTQDFYGGSPINLGPLAGYENLIASGWIDGQTIEFNPELSTVKFTVHGPAYWLAHVSSWPAGIRDVTGNPTQWNEYNNFTEDAFYWHVIRWRSTASEVMDCFPSGDMVRMVGSTAPWGTIWGQITQVGQSRRLLQPYANRYGQVYFMPPTKYVLNQFRTQVPVVMDVNKLDWRDSIEAERRTVQEVAYQDTTAMTWDGTNPNGFRAGAWGTAAGRFGSMENTTELYVSAVTSGSYGALFGQQVGTNKMAGLLLAAANNPLPSITVPMSANNRFLDIAPNQFFTLSMAASDSPRGLALYGQNVAPNQISYSWDPESGYLAVDIVGEGATVPIDGYPLPFYTGGDIQNPPNTPTPPNGNNTIPNIPPPPWYTGPCTSGTSNPNKPLTIPINATVYSTSTSGSAIFIPWHGKITSIYASHRTVLTLLESTFTSSVPTPGPSDWVSTGNMYGVTIQGCDSSGTPILTAIAAGSVAGYYDGLYNGQRSFVFTNGSAVEVYGFLITAVPGSVTYTWTPTSGSPIIVMSGSPLYYFSSNQMGWTGNSSLSGSTGGYNVGILYSNSGSSANYEYYLESMGDGNDMTYYGDGQHAYHAKSWGFYHSTDNIGMGTLYFGPGGRYIGYTDGIPTYDSGFTDPMWMYFFDQIESTDGYNFRGYFGARKAYFSFMSIYPPWNWGYAWMSVIYNQSYKVGIAQLSGSAVNNTKATLYQLTVFNWCRYSDP
jgi:hypothetical protein